MFRSSTSFPSMDFNAMAGGSLRRDKMARFSIAPAAAADRSGSSILQAVKQLGLKLQGLKGLIETIVIDHLAKTPTES